MVASPAVSVARIACARAFIEVRSFIAVRWIQRNASASEMPLLGHQPALGLLHDLARLEPLLQVGDLGVQGAHLLEAATATSIAGTRSFLENGLTR